MRIGVAITDTRMYTAGLFIPMPMSKHAIPVRSKLKKNIPPDKEMIALLNVNPSPVNRNEPTTKPIVTHVAPSSRYF